MLPEFSASFPVLLAVSIAAYGLGSIPFGLIVARTMGLGNLRDIGSGNIGATNVLRTGNKLAAFLTLIFDAGKGAVAVLCARAFIGDDAAQIAGLFAFLGHIYPVWLKFRGGKGVATVLGVLVALNVSAGIAVCMTWLAVALVTRYSSLSALLAALSAIGWLWILDESTAMGLAILLCSLIWLRHWPNIVRLANSTEPKIGKKGG